tara:strand:- start:927 stop:1079 length:153 start_codon:yes stop_codon:yes gene_type:complete
MPDLEYFYIQQWKNDEEIRDDRRDMVYRDDDCFTLHDDVPIVEEDGYNGE